MGRDVPFQTDAVCDSCGAEGAFDFMGDYLCPKCSEMAIEKEDHSSSVAPAPVSEQSAGLERRVEFAAIRRRLPKAPLIDFEWSWGHFYFHKFRLANAIRLQVGWLTIGLRAPWLEHSARTIYPHLFTTPVSSTHVAQDEREEAT